MFGQQVTILCLCVRSSGSGPFSPKPQSQRGPAGWPIEKNEETQPDFKQSMHCKNTAVPTCKSVCLTTQQCQIAHSWTKVQYWKSSGPTLQRVKVQSYRTWYPYLSESRGSGILSWRKFGSVVSRSISRTVTFLLLAETKALDHCNSTRMFPLFSLPFSCSHVWVQLSAERTLMALYFAQLPTVGCRMSTNHSILNKATMTNTRNIKKPLLEALRVCWFRQSWPEEAPSACQNLYNKRAFERSNGVKRGCSL